MTARRRKPQPDLFSFEPPKTYPESPGFKVGGTSQEAAESMDESSDTLRMRALAILQRERLTSDEVAERMGRSILAVRPRVTELHKLSLIRDTGERRKNASGRRANVWVAV